MDQEIDLRPYLAALVRHWRLIIIFMLVLVFVGAASIAITPLSQRASADVLVIPATSQITLDPRFPTTNSNNLSNPAAARQALINLASSHIVAAQVAKDLGEAEVSGDQLLQQVNVTSSGDLLQISVSNADQARALKIAEVWGKAYERLVADIYSRSQGQADLLTSNIAAAQLRYDNAQTALEAFLKNGKSLQVQSQITSLTHMLDSSLQTQQLRYTDYLTRTRQLDLLLQDAQTLRDQVSTQGSSSFADSFAALLLRARTVDSRLLSFQLNTNDITSAPVPSRDLSATLAQLIEVLTRRRDEMSAQAEVIAAAIADNTTLQQPYREQLATLVSSYEQLQAKQQLLTQQRDLARDTLLLLQRKQDEQEVARTSPSIEVRFISANTEPKLSLVVQTIQRGLVGGFVGLILGALLAILLDVLFPALRRLNVPEPTHPAARNDTTADRPIPGD